VLILIAGVLKKRKVSQVSSYKVPSSSSSSEELSLLFNVEVKLLRKGLGEVGIQFVRRGGVEGRPTTLPGEVHAKYSQLQVYFELKIPAMIHLSRDKEMDVGMMSRMKLVGEAVEGGGGEEILLG